MVPIPTLISGNSFKTFSATLNAAGVLKVISIILTPPFKSASDAFNATL